MIKVLGFVTTGQIAWKLWIWS